MTSRQEKDVLIACTIITWQSRFFFFNTSFACRNMKFHNKNSDQGLAAHYSNVIMNAMASQITGIPMVSLLFRRRSKKTSKLRVTGLYAGNSPVTGEFPSQMASNAGNVSIWWRHHAIYASVNWITNDLKLLPERMLIYWPALRASLLCCNFFGRPGSVSKFPPLLWVKLWVGWVGRGYTEISRYFPASWINWVTLVTKIKLLYSLRF